MALVIAFLLIISSMWVSIIPMNGFSISRTIEQHPYHLPVAAGIHLEMPDFMMKFLQIAAIILASVALSAGCSQETKENATETAESASRDLKQGADKAVETVEEGAAEVGQAAETVGEEAAQAVEDAADKVEEETDELGEESE